MIIIGEKINGAIPAVKEAIANRNSTLIAQRATAQAEAGADYIDCAPSTVPELEYDTMCWLIDAIQSATDRPISIDSPNAKLLAKIIEEGKVNKPGIVNSVNEESDKCETIFPLIAGTDWQVIGLTCDKDGIPSDPHKKLDIAKSIIDKAVRYNVDLKKLHIDPCVMALSTVPSAMKDLVWCIRAIHEYAPDVNVLGAVSNVSYEMPCRKYINASCMAYAIEAGLNSAIVDPCSVDMMSTIYASEALCMIDKSGRKYNRAYRRGLIGTRK